MNIKYRFLLDGFIQNLVAYERTPETFDEQIWMVVIDKVVVQTDGGLVFWLKDGSEIIR